MGKKRRKTAKKTAEDGEGESPAVPVAQASERPEEDDDLLPILEAMLFAAHEPLSVGRLASALSASAHGSVRRARVKETLDRLQELLIERRSPLQLVEIAGGLRLVTRPEYAPFLARLLHKAERERLSPAALETLAIIAYRQPVTRADIEAIRGVQAGPVVRLLQDRRMIRMVGRAEVVGRPQQFGTTKRFLDHFGLANLKDLPQVLGEDGQPMALFDAPPAGNGAAPAANGQGEVSEASVADGTELADGTEVAEGTEGTESETAQREPVEPETAEAGTAEPEAASQEQ